MTARRYAVVNGESLRMTAVDSCGVPRYGIDQGYLVTDGFVSVATTVNVDDGTAIEQRNAKGTKTVNVRPRPKVDNVTHVITFDKVDPEAYSMATGQKTIYDPETGDAIGYKVNSDVRPSDTHLALETWGEVDVNLCTSGDQEYDYNLYPFLQGGVIGDYTLENGLVSFSVTRIESLDGTQWAEGPYKVMKDDTGTDSVLVGDAVVETNDHVISFLTTVPPPANTDGAVPLDNPEATLATTATAGTPGTFDSANRPASSMTGLTASPTTAWSTGQYVETENGAKWHWSGTAWASGKAT